MSVDGVSGLAVAATAGGALLIWSGIRGVSVTKSLGSLISGKPPDKTQTTAILASYDQPAASAASPAGTSAAGSAGGAAGAPPAVSGRYSHAQLEALWKSQGGAGATANTAAAVAQAESGGDPNALNHNSNGTVDRGLWQINSIWGALSTTDPAANARAAISISKNGLNWSPWVTYNRGTYRQFIGSS